MSRFVRLPLTLLAVLAALFFLPGTAFGDPPPTPEQCAADATLSGCSDAVGEDTSGDVVAPGPVVEQPKDQPPTGQDEGTEQLGGLAGQTPGAVVPAFPAFPLGRLAQAPSGPVVGALAEPTATTPAQICEAVPTFPGCDDAPSTPNPPLSCEQIGDILGTDGCPDDFTCEDLAELLGLSGCPEGPPTCEELSALFALEGCPAPPTSCTEFASLLGVDDCSQIPCLDTSKLPQEARDGLKQLFDGLENIGIKQCPVKPASGGGTTPPGKGTPMPPAAVRQQQTPYYATCDDARAKGASNIPAGTPGYRPELDSDSDGIACETDTAQPVAQSTQQPTGKLAYTGFDLETQLTLVWTMLVAGSGLLVVTRRRA